jgi:hypothetical protein
MLDVPLGVPSDSLRQRPDVLAAEAAVRSTAAKVGVAPPSSSRIFHCPPSPAGGSTTASPFTGNGSIWSSSAELTQPIFHSSALRARRKAAIAAYQAAIAHYQRTVLNALQNAADSLAALDQDARTLRASQDAVTSAAQVFTDTQARYRLGAVSHPVSSPAKSDGGKHTYRKSRRSLTDWSTLPPCFGDGKSRGNHHSRRDGAPHYSDGPRVASSAAARHCRGLLNS